MFILASVIIISDRCTLTLSMVASMRKVGVAYGIT